MKVEKNMFVLCENVLLDVSKKVTLVNIYDIIFSDTIPALHPKLTFVANLTVNDPEKDIKTIKFALNIKTPSGKELSPKPLNIESSVDGSKQRQNIGIVMEINGVVFPEWGVYNTSLSMNGKPFSILKFEVGKRMKPTHAD